MDTQKPHSSTRTSHNQGTLCTYVGGRGPQRIQFYPSLHPWLARYAISAPAPAYAPSLRSLAAAAFLLTRFLTDLRKRESRGSCSGNQVYKGPDRPNGSVPPRGCNNHRGVLGSNPPQGL